MNLPPKSIHDWTRHEDQDDTAVLWCWHEDGLMADIWVRAATGKWCWAIESEGGADLGHGTVSCLDDALEAVREALNDE